MSRPCRICSHKARRQIDAALVAGLGYRYLKQLWPEVSKFTVTRHKQRHIPELLAKAARTREVADAEAAKDLVAQASRFLARANEMLEACGKWLRDPATGEIVPDPRPDEVRVFYSDASSGQEVRRQAALSDLLAKIERRDKTIMVTSWRYRHADPRLLFLQAIDKGARVVELLGKLSGELSLLPQIDEVIQLVADALRPYPPALVKVLKGLREAGAVPPTLN